MRRERGSKKRGRERDKEGKKGRKGGVSETRRLGQSLSRSQLLYRIIFTSATLQCTTDDVHKRINMFTRDIYIPVESMYTELCDVCA